MLPGNAMLNVLELEPGGAYSKASRAADETFDVIAIGGRDRINCAHTAASALTAGGVSRPLRSRIESLFAIRAGRHCSQDQAQEYP